MWSKRLMSFNWVKDWIVNNFFYWASRNFEKPEARCFVYSKACFLLVSNLVCSLYDNFHICSDKTMTTVTIYFMNIMVWKTLGANILFKRMVFWKKHFLVSKIIQILIFYVHFLGGEIKQNSQQSVWGNCPCFYVSTECFE